MFFPGSGISPVSFQSLATRGSLISPALSWANGP